MSLAREYNQENLVNVNKMQMRAIEEKIDHNYFLDLTRNSGYWRDRKVAVRKNGERILTVVHMIPNVEKGSGLKLVYKVDKELFENYIKTFGEK